MRFLTSLGVTFVTVALALPARPAEAQTTRLCVSNQSGTVIRSRAVMDAHGRAEETTNWVTLALGQSHCEQRDNLVSYRLQIEVSSVFSWHPGCEFRDRRTSLAHNISYPRSMTVTTRGTVFNLTCQT